MAALFSIISQSTNLHTVLFISIVVAAAHACDIEEVRSSAAKGPMPGGWFRSAEVDNEIFNQVKLLTANADSAVDKSVRVTEAYSQVVAGMNYCIRFSAAGSCDSKGYCSKSMECVVGVHQPLSSAPNPALSITAPQCQQIEACDIEAKRENAKTPRPGGWFSEPVNHSDVDALQEHASQIAAVRKGRVTETFYQVVAGRNYCIRFESEGLEGCAETSGGCGAVSCVASGFLPLPFRNSNSDSVQQPIRKIGVSCEGPGLQTGSRIQLQSSPSGAGKTMTSPMMTSLVALTFAAFLL